PAIQTFIAPAYARQSTAQTFSFVVENTDTNAANVVRNIKITLPDGFIGVTQAGITTSFSAGTWNTPVITGNGTTGNPFVITVATANPAPHPALPPTGVGPGSTLTLPPPAVRISTIAALRLTSARSSPVATAGHQLGVRTP